MSDVKDLILVVVYVICWSFLLARLSRRPEYKRPAPLGRRRPREAASWILAQILRKCKRGDT